MYARPASDDSIPREGLPVDQEPRSTTTELMAHPDRGMASASGVRTDTKRSKKPRELLNVKSLGEINHVHPT